jgi:hypothetical protein
MKNLHYYFVLLLVTLCLQPCPLFFTIFTNAQHNNDVDKCPSISQNPSCPCYNFEDGIFLECPSISLRSLKSVLNLVKAPIKSLSIYDLSKNVTVFPDNLFSNHTVITHLQITQSALKDFQDNSLQVLRFSLESLGILHGNLQQIPQRALSGLALRGLNLEGNAITELPSYSFYGLHLMKVSLKFV